MNEFKLFSRMRMGFHFTRQMRLVCADMAARLPQLRHIDLDRVAVCYCQARKSTRHGLQAALTPLRFEAGSLVTLRHGRRFGAQRLFDESGRELLYLLSFYLPRFLNQTFREKLVTVLHELWHISPQFDGDLRRHEGRCYIHSASEREYDAVMERLADEWLALRPPPKLYGFLRKRFGELRREHGAVYGTRIRAPKLIPLS